MKMKITMKSSISTTHCAIDNCNTTILNKAPGVTFHSCPSTSEMRNKWIKILKNRCTILDLERSRFCSKHFDNKYFDSHRKLKENAIPTMFSSSSQKVIKTAPPLPKSKVDRLLNKMTQADLTADIKASLNRMKEPTNLDSVITENLKCKPEASIETKLWLIIKKQEHLNSRLMDLVVQTKKHVDILQTNIEESKSNKKENEQNVESLKYIVKCLQEKQTTLEEQIEILTAVESK